MTHTPGPWRIYRNKHNGTFLLSGGDKSKNQCFPVLHASDSTNTEYMSNPSPANANLIAAAPDMLEALKSTLAELCFLRDEIGSGLDDQILLIKAAIAKAEGNPCN
jgi:hypothetical protein